MTDPPPVVISQLKLPPESQPFFRFKEILLLFREKLEHLTLTLASTQDIPDTRPVLPPKFQSILWPLQVLASDQANLLALLLTHVRGLTKATVDFLDALPLSFTESRPPKKFRLLSIHGRITAEKYEEAERGMEEFQKTILSAVEQLRTLVSSSDDSREASVMNEENSQIVNELIQAAREGSALLHEAAQYYRDMEGHFKNDKPFREQSPPTEEINATRESWIAFSKSLANFEQDLPAIASALRKGGSVFEARQLARLWAKFGSTNAQGKDGSPAPRAIQEANISNTTPDSPTRSTSPKVSFWRSLLRRVLPCIYHEQRN
ncbi:hypothetical protein AN958_11875 [Leucoagaricus sp. SymC.cos]|nr:hypothetical protein AN958_11875 [Leucoagaricus sp. SymC.cos]